MKKKLNKKNNLFCLSSDDALPANYSILTERLYNVLKEFSLDFNSGNFKIADAISSGRNEGRKKNHNNIFSEVKNITLLPTTYRKAKAFMYRQSKNSDS